MSDLFLGTEATKEFYERTGWHRKDGVLIDGALFTPTSVGPILRSIIDRREQVICEMVGKRGVHLIECGCGATPAVYLGTRCDSFTAVDFSAVGLIEASAKLEASGLKYRTVKADITRLPFADSEFDTAYSAHVLYHIASPAGQAAALAEMMRVVRPGGRVVLVLANPFPLLFPGRLIRRTLAATPIVGMLLNIIRSKPVLPYRPMRLGWYKKQFTKWGDVQIAGNAIPSTWFDRKVSERSRLSRAAWRSIRWIEKRCPITASRLGCYVTVCASRSAAKRSESCLPTTTNSQSKQVPPSSLQRAK